MSLLFSIYFALRALVIPCPGDDCGQDARYKTNLSKIHKLHEAINESSGLVRFRDFYITINDSGGEPVLFFLDGEMDLVETVLLENIRNVDWESVTTDGDSNIYIGDFGNNANKREDLRVIKWNYETRQSSLIEFYYPDQDLLPPVLKKDFNYDCESMIWLDNQLLLFSKNDRNKFVKVYSLPDTPGIHEATIIDTILVNEQLTGVTMLDNNLVFISYGKVLFYTFDGSIPVNPEICAVDCRRILRGGQSEAIAFEKPGKLLITNEKGRVFRLSIKNVVKAAK